jgi:hypothetical protein
LGSDGPRHVIQAVGIFPPGSLGHGNQSLSPDVTPPCGPPGSSHILRRGPSPCIADGNQLPAALQQHPSTVARVARHLLLLAPILFHDLDLSIAFSHLLPCCLEARASFCASQSFLFSSVLALIPVDVHKGMWSDCSHMETMHQSYLHVCL